MSSSKKEIVRIFEEADAPTLGELVGYYQVEMVTGVPSLKRFNHRKFFTLKDGVLAGYNVLGRDWRWGVFTVVESSYADRATLKIDYDRVENMFSRLVVDHIRRVRENDFYVGRFNIKLFGRLIFLGYFTLTKIK